nr:leucine--tRNA ligase [bacterium]
DIISRKRRMEGYNVLFPIGWDAFGLPTENYAIKNHVHPRAVTQKNIDHFREQLQKLGFSFDYNREVNTTDPAYYRWTQWIFLQMFKKGLAYKMEMPINWCTSCKCGLANEEVVGGVCERCGGQVERRVKSQWMLKITAYAQRLLDDLDDVDFIEKVKTQQRNWIGRSEGAHVDFAIRPVNGKVTVYTTRPDTLFGATYMVLSPEHPLVDEWKQSIENFDEVLAYRHQASLKSDFERTEVALDKTGVPLKGIVAVNPVNGREIPVWISDYVLMGYGTGAIMAVPAHDERDYAFAKKFDLPMIEVVSGGDITKQAFTEIESGHMVNSDFLDGMVPAKAKGAMIDYLEEKGLGKRAVQFKLRDWVFSRQRYWGEPIPLVWCDTCGWVPVPEEQLPVTLPEVEAYEPTDNGESPLAHCTDWVNTTCPHCGGPARRETDTMPQWAGSSWYFLRYTDPQNDQALASPEALSYWLPVDWYNGGMEHTTLHLLYSRFWHKFLYDIGMVPTKEPYQKRTSHGMILGENGEKMSKSRGNVINPDDIVAEIGADAFRVYEMFMGAFDQAIPWSTTGARGSRRFLDRVWRLQDMLVEGDGFSQECRTLMHQTIRKVGQDYEQMKFNTAIAQMMTLVNRLYEIGRVTRGELITLVTLLNPVAPHITEEIYQNIGGKGGLVRAPWPQYDEALCREDTVEMAIQVLGKVRAKVTMPAGADEAAIREAALADANVQRWLEGKTVQKIIIIPGRLVNIVAK